MPLGGEDAEIPCKDMKRYFRMIAAGFEDGDGEEEGADSGGRIRGQVPVPAPSNGATIQAPHAPGDKDAECPVFPFRHAAAGSGAGDCRDPGTGSQPRAALRR